MVRVFSPLVGQALPSLGLACVLAFAAQAATATDDSTVEITTDTLAYCGQLHDRVEAMLHAMTTSPSQEVTELSTQGQRMCDHGLARPGIMRLRRAIAILSHPAQGR